MSLNFWKSTVYVREKLQMSAAYNYQLCIHSYIFSDFCCLTTCNANFILEHIVYDMDSKVSCCTAVALTFLQNFCEYRPVVKLTVLFCTSSNDVTMYVQYAKRKMGGK